MGEWTKLGPSVNRLLQEALYACPRVLIRPPNSSHKTSTRQDPHPPLPGLSPGSQFWTELSAPMIQTGITVQGSSEEVWDPNPREVRGASWVLGAPEVPLLEGTRGPNSKRATYAILDPSVGESKELEQGPSGQKVSAHNQGFSTGPLHSSSLGPSSCQVPFPPSVKAAAQAPSLPPSGQSLVNLPQCLLCAYPFLCPIPFYLGARPSEGPERTPPQPSQYSRVPFLFGWCRIANSVVRCAFP